MLTISKKKSIQLGWRLFQKLEEAALLTPTGQSYALRTAEPADLPLLAGLLSELSDNTRYLRFLSPVPAFRGERAVTEARNLWLNNPWPTIVLLATTREADQEKIIGLGELHINPQDATEAEFALLVRDDWQGQGIGTVLLQRLVAQASKRGLTVLFAEMLAQNRAMRQLFTKLKLPVRFKFEGGSLGVRIELPRAARVA